MNLKEEKDFTRVKQQSKHVSKFTYKLTQEPETSCWDQLKIVSEISVPQIFTTVAFQLINISSIYYVGHQGDTNILAGLGMGNVLISAICLAFSFGLNGTLESKVSQAYGSDDFEMCGVWLNRGRMINTVLMVPIGILFLCTEQIMLAMGQPEIVAKYAAQYCRIMIPGAWAMIQFDATKRFSSSQLKPNLPLIAQMVSTFFHAVWCYLFIKKMQWGIFGAAIALNITYFMNMLILDSLITQSPEFEKTRVPHDKRSFTEWDEYFKIGLYGAMLECLGWWNLNICFMFSGYLGIRQIAVQVIITQIKNFTTMIPTGVSFAASGLIGNCIGMNQVRRAKQYEQVSILFSVFVTSLMLLVFQLFSKQLAELFTDDEDLITMTQSNFWALFLYIFWSTIKGVQNGVVRCLGQQKKNTFVTLGIAYGFGIPLAYLFCFVEPVNMGLQGMWFGISIANFMLVCAINLLIRSVDWDAIAYQKYQEKLQAQQQAI